MLTGEYLNTLDDKGRLSFPAKFREELGIEKLVVTKGLDNCLWVFHPVKWEEVKRKITENTSPFQAKARRLRNTLIAPAQEVEIDKTGRIAILQSLRDYAGLTKDCVVAGVETYFEIWDREQRELYFSNGRDELGGAAEELGIIF